MIDKFVERLLREIAEDRERLVVSVLSGQPSFERYHALTGEIRGLDRAAQRARDLISPMLDRGHPLKEPDDSHRHGNGPQGPASDASRMVTRRRAFGALS